MSNDKSIKKEILCPLEYANAVFGGKWKPRIICILNSYKTLRYNQIKKELTNISDAVLADMLKELINDGIVKRVQYNEIPPHVDYSLTEKGLNIHPVLKTICNWSKENMEFDTTKNHPVCVSCSEIKN